MALEPFEVDAMLFVLEKHFNEACLPISLMKDMFKEWVDIVEEHYAAQEDVPPWVIHLGEVKEQFDKNMLIEDDCVIFVAGEDE